jgi:hypothetical protein
MPIAKQECLSYLVSVDSKDRLQKITNKFVVLQELHSLYA